jgi:hypothetical protein
VGCDCFVVGGEVDVFDTVDAVDSVVKCESETMPQKLNVLKPHKIEPWQMR